ncbi:MAG TPA: hypothetical protein VN808_17190 [Stellaceae bacterium]|nr:hypothetical protein [Stellaceae bacterium]
MSGIPLIYEGVEFSLIQETRGWVANIPRFGRTMYFASQEEAIDEAVRLINAFLLPRVIRQLDHAA